MSEEQVNIGLPMLGRPCLIAQAFVRKMRRRLSLEDIYRDIRLNYPSISLTQDEISKALRDCPHFMAHNVSRIDFKWCFRSRQCQDDRINKLTQRTGVYHEYKILLDDTLDPCTFSNYDELNVERSCKYQDSSKSSHKEVGEQILKYKISKENVRGQEIKIDIPNLTEGQELIVRIHYSTAPEPRALQFLAKEQTTDKNAPYMFSQCRPNHVRSILPCMDTPSSKSSYMAKVEVPANLTCLMSAISEKKEILCDRAVYSFYQKVPIPPYLIAIVVGHLEKREISDRVAVWSEPTMADAARYEFEDTENVLKVAEDLAGKYVWGRYDMVVLPATYFFGGNGHPCLNFVHPFIIAGDKSLVSYGFHDIAQNWTGHLVTHSSWEQLWLNEGFTLFLERKIHGRMFGELERQFEAEKGFNESLFSTVRYNRDIRRKFTSLVQNQKGIDPCKAISLVSSEKGSAFLIHIDQTLGASERFEQFIRSYIAKYAYKSVTTLMWRTELYDFFPDKKAQLDIIDWNRWFYDEGVPPKPRYDSTLMNACRELARQWKADTTPTDASSFTKMGTSQRISVLEAIRRSGNFKKISREEEGESKMTHLTELYQLNATKNCEIKFRWLRLGIESKWEPIVVPALSFALDIGSSLYCEPIYKALFEWEVSKTAAVDQFKKTIPSLHYVTVNNISKFLPE